MSEACNECGLELSYREEMRGSRMCDACAIHAPRDADVEKLIAERDAALRRAEEAEAIANLAMSEGLQAVADAERDFHEVCESLGAVDEMHGLGFVCPDAGTICDSIRSLLEESGYYADMRTPRERDAWHEDYGPVLWWKLPVCEPPYAGTPLDDDFPDYVTHWTLIMEPFGADGDGDFDA